MSIKEWNSPYNSFNSWKGIIWREWFEEFAKGMDANFPPPIQADVDLSPLCNFNCPHCIPKNEVITLAIGRNKRVQNVVVGDVLLAYDEESNNVVETVVQKVFKRESSEYLKVTLSNGKILKLTKEHPVYSNGAWVPIGDLKIGDNILSISSTDKMSFRMKKTNPMSNIGSIEKKKMSCAKNDTYKKISNDMKQKWEDGRMVGHAMTIENRNKASIRMKKDNPMNSRQVREKVSNTLKGRYKDGSLTVTVSDKQKESARNRMLHRNPMFDEDSKKKRLRNIDYSSFMHKVFQSNGSLSKNSLEDSVYALIPEELKDRVYYNNDAKYKISINNQHFRIPDFVVFDCSNEVVGVIEVGITDAPKLRWNKTPEVLAKISEDYTSKGLPILFIGNLDIKNAKEEVHENLRDFITMLPQCPHNVEIVGIDEEPYNDYVYNFECGPFNNYYVNNILVHNCNAYDIIDNDSANLPIEHWLNVSDFLKEWGVKSACVAGGGEPMRHSGLGEFLLRQKQNGIQNGLISNGSLMTETLIEIIAETCRYAGFSIDAGTNETYMMLKGIQNPKTFLKVIRDTERLSKQISNTDSSCDLAWKYLITPDNAHEIFESAKIAKSIGVKDFHSRPVGFDNIRKTSGLTNEALVSVVDVINEQIAKAMELEDENFRFFGIRHKFKPNFERKVGFEKCRAIPLVATFCADGKLYLCFDRRGDPTQVLCDHYPDLTKVLDVWGSYKHKKIMDDVDPLKCPRCFIGSTKVLTKSGVMDIDKISVGDKVISHQGNEQKVINTFIRPYNDKGYKVFLKRHTDPIVCTPEHPFLVLRTKKCHYKDIVCKPDCNYLQHRKDYSSTFTCNEYHNDYKIEWVKAEDISHDDYMAVPLVYNQENNVSLNISDYVDNTKYVVEQGTIFCRYGRNDQKKLFNNLINVDQFVKIAGFYLAEGWTHKDGVSFCFHKNEVSYLDDLKFLMKDVFNIDPYIYTRDNVTTFTYYSLLLRELFSNMFGSMSYQKRIPEWVFDLNKKSQECFIKYYWYGDGNYNKDIGISFSTTSDSLAYQFQFLLYQIGIDSVKLYKIKSRTSYIGTRKIDYTKPYNWSVSFPLNNRFIADIFDLDYDVCKTRKTNKRVMSDVFRNRDYVFVPIKRIEETIINEKVYNLEVENDNSFLVENVCAHNCTFGPYNEMTEHIFMKDEMCRFFP